MFIKCHVSSNHIRIKCNVSSNHETKFLTYETKAIIVTSILEQIELAIICESNVCNYELTIITIFLCIDYQKLAGNIISRYFLRSTQLLPLVMR